jgi:hypothetical protein
MRLPLAPSILRREVDVLLTHIMRRESKVCAVAETVHVNEGSFDRAIASDFEEEE